MPISFPGLLVLLVHLQFFFQPFRIYVPKVFNTQFKILITPVFQLSPTPEVSLMPSTAIVNTPIPTAIPTNTPVPTVLVTPTSTITPTPMITATPTPTLTATPSPILETTLTATPIPTDTPTPASSQNVTPPLSPAVTPTETPATSPTATPSVGPTVETTPIASVSPSLELTATPTSSLTATPSPTPTVPPDIIGNDISYPQCGHAYPTGQDFGIVGVNGGKATTTNLCLGSELSWANETNVVGSQSKIQLYVNTGNPGGLNTPSWPQNNTDPAGNNANNPYGSCDGSDSLACSWQYGWNRAVDDIVSKFAPAAQTAGIAVDPSIYPWWLDVETANSWESGSDDALKKNAADLEGMVAYFSTRNMNIGIYSTHFQWGEIINTVSASSSLNGLPNWRPGASDLEEAKLNCAVSPLTPGGKVILTQYTLGDFDYDYACK